MRDIVTIIHKTSANTYSLHTMEADYKQKLNTSIASEDVTHYKTTMFLLPFGDYEICVGDYIAKGEIKEIDNLLSVLESTDSYSVRDVEEVEQKYSVKYRYRVNCVE